LGGEKKKGGQTKRGGRKKLTGIEGGIRRKSAPLRGKKEDIQKS